MSRFFSVTFVRLFAVGLFVAGGAQGLTGQSLSLAWAGPQDTSAAAPSTQPLPRYRFEPGQEVTYEHTWQFTQGAETRGQNGRWRLLVLAVDSEGRAEIWVERRVKPYQTRGEDRYEGAESVLIDRMIVAPDGTPTYELRVDSDLNPYEIFPRLPQGAGELTDGWFANYVSGHGTSHYQFSTGTDESGSPSAGWLIDDEESSAFTKIYDIYTQRRFVFDGTSPFPVSIERQSGQGYGVPGTGNGGLKRLEVKSVALAKEREDLDRYLKALRDLNTQRRIATESDPASSQELSEAVAVALEKSAASIETELLKTSLTKRANQVRLEAPYVRQAAERRAQALAAKSVPWSSQDLDGKPYSIADYRGKVVLLDFWYRGSGWCIRNMPTINRLVNRYRDEPFQVLGLNSDPNPADARFVADTLKLQYPTLVSGPAKEAYQVRVYPTILILDHEGVVREVHLGYVPNLEDELIAEIEPLLAAAKKANSSK